MWRQQERRALCLLRIFITELFCWVDDVMREEPRHPQANPHPSETVTLALLFVIKGAGNRAFYRWAGLCAALPGPAEAHPPVPDVRDSPGIELLHPIREGRSEVQIGKKGKSNFAGLWAATPASGCPASYSTSGASGRVGRRYRERA